MYNRESKIMRKLLGKTASDATPGDLSVTSTTASMPISSAYRPAKSQNAAYSLSAPAACLDVTADRRSVVFGGAHILKTAVLDGAESPEFNVSEGIDIRAAITSQKISGSRANLVSDQLNIRHVKWSGTSTIFTACASGRIFAYDLARIGTGASATESLEYIQMQEDSRQVNSLDVNPHLPSWLLSGSQDGIARVFDVSQSHPTRSGVLSFRQRFTPLKSNDPIREVMWSPKVGHEMACCTEAGVVLKWDVRQASRPVLRINAHEKACTTIAWHPDGTHLVSAGWDTKVQVWDLSNTADKRQKPKYTLTAPAPVSTLAWRPGLWSATTQSKRSAQIAVSYDDGSSRRYGSSVVHIWDFARPTMPYKEIERFDTSPSDLFWRDQDFLWTVGQDGVFNQCDIAFAPKKIDRHSTSAVAFSSRGDTMMFLEERVQPRPRTIMRASELDTIPAFSTSPRTPVLVGSKSDSEEDVMDTFLGPRKRTGHRRRLSSRGLHPSSSVDSEEPTRELSLEQSINLTGTFRTQQSMTWGQTPTVKLPGVFQFMSAHYLDILVHELPPTEDGGVTLAQRVGIILERFAVAAQSASFFRLSQTWRIIAFAMNVLLNKRAEHHMHQRLARFQKIELESAKNSQKYNTPAIHVQNGDETPRLPSGRNGSIDARAHGMRSLLSEEFESTSNVPTPIAYPADGQHPHGHKLPSIIEPESLKLGAAAHHSFADTDSTAAGSVDATGTSSGSHESHESLTEGYDFYDTDALVRAIDMPLKSAQSHPKRAKAVRQDSEESFSQLFSISDGAKKSEEDIRKREPEQSSTAEETTQESDGYPSLIRGEELDDESQQGTVRRRRRDSRPPADSPEDVFMISQTTASGASGDGTYRTYPSQQSFISGSDSDQMQSFRTSTVATDGRSQRADSFPQLELAYQLDPRPHIIETDYLPWPGDSEEDPMKGDSAMPAALNPYELIRSALAFETRTSTLNSSAMVLLLKPLVPNSVIDSHQARGILRQHHSRLMGLSLFVEAALLRKLSVQGWPEGLPEWGESYPTLFSQAQQQVKVGLFCSSCRKPRDSEPDAELAAVWTCDRCEATMAPCAVCQHRDPELAATTADGFSSSDDDEEYLAGWWHCPGCGHGGHASCLQLWHETPESSDHQYQDRESEKYSDGCCPLDGCGHACLPGKYRGETTTARSGSTAAAAAAAAQRAHANNAAATPRRTSGKNRATASVKADVNEAVQSKAVGIARDALSKSGSAIASGGILSSSPGRIPGTGERERRKSVKFANSES